MKVVHSQQKIIQPRIATQNVADMGDGILSNVLLPIFAVFLVICAVQVRAENIARGKPAVQLGTWDRNTADRAVDGNTNSDLYQLGCAHPYSGDMEGRPPTWWSVDLAGGRADQWYVVKRVVIYNRRTQQGRIGGTSIKTGNDSDVYSQLECNFTDTNANQAIINKTCEPNRPVRYLSLVREGGRETYAMGLCEVEVEGYRYTPCEDGRYGENCAEFCQECFTCFDINGTCKGCPVGRWGRGGCPMYCHCFNDDDCDDETGYCQLGCAEPFTGIDCQTMGTKSTTTTSTTTTTEPSTVQISTTAQPSTSQIINSQVVGIQTPTVGTSKTSVETPSTTPSVEVQKEMTKDNGGLIAAIVVVLLVILIVAVVVAVCVVRSRQGHPVKFWKKTENALIPSAALNHKGMDPELAQPTKIDNQSYDTDSVSTIEPQGTPSSVKRLSVLENVYANPEPIPNIHINELAEYIERKRNEPNGFRDEYKTIPIGATAKWDVGNKIENKNKNRFLNIRAYDHSRVVLDIEDDDVHSDYINADYISGYKDEPKTYIACQGPKKETIKDMWRMMWQVNTNCVVMVTNLIEGGKLKCEQYWPDRDNPTQTHGKLKVTLVSTDLYADYVIRVFSLSKGEESRMIHQFHFTSWPDHGVPPVATSLLDFRKRVRTFQPFATGPLLIHCSAGIGRTGTYIAVDYLLNQAEGEKEINVYNFTVLMRTQRVNMIQTLDQYIFVYEAVLEALKSGETAIPTSNFKEAFEKLLEEDPETNKTKLTEQFEILESLKPRRKTEEKVGLEVANIEKNRSKDLVPSNRYRPYISTHVDGTTNYINAVYINGYRSRNMHIATQMPLPHTAVDFWRLLNDHHSCSVIMLNEVDKNDETCEVYWPEEKEHSLTFGPLEVTLTNVDSEDPGITIREFTLSNNQSTKEPEVIKQFHLTCWTKDETGPKDPKKILELLDMVEKWQQQNGNGPITVHCMHGAERSGVLVALSFLLEKLKVDQEVDVFLSVKHVRIPREEFIQDLDQYQFLHEMALLYLESFGQYSNFK